MYFHFKLKNSDFQTGWFLESVLTELCILFIIRTKKSFIYSKPGKALIITSAIAFVITVILPISPLADSLSLGIAHTQQIIAIALILLLYVITADGLKILFFKLQDRKIIKTNV